jgi:hypothetical protein
MAWAVSKIGKCPDSYTDIVYWYNKTSHKRLLAWHIRPTIITNRSLDYFRGIKCVLVSKSSMHFASLYCDGTWCFAAWHNNHHATRGDLLLHFVHSISSIYSTSDMLYSLIFTLLCLFFLKQQAAVGSYENGADTPLLLLVVYYTEPLYTENKSLMFSLDSHLQSTNGALRFCHLVLYMCKTYSNVLGLLALDRMDRPR